MNLDKNLPALVMKNLEDNMGVITKYLKQTEDKALYLLLEKPGLVNPVWLNLRFPMLYTLPLSNLKNVITFRRCSQVLM